MAILTLLLAAAAAQASPGQPRAAPPSADENQRIVVIGQRLGGARQRLEQCIARGCPPGEDIAATLAYAEALFINGDYRQARAILRASIARNRGAAARHPIGVSGLYRANARMAMHEGDGEDVRRSTYNVEWALREGLARTDPRILGARLETGEMYAALRQNELARRVFRETAAAAREIGRADIAALADLRSALLSHRLGHSDARARLQRVAQLTEPEARVQRLAARIILASIDRRAGDTGATDRLIADLAAAGVRTPTLLHAPPIQVPNAATTAGAANVNGDAIEMRNMATAGSSEGFDYWVDVGFWINAQGRTEEVEVLRSHGPQHWLAPVLASIRGRIYSPPASAELSYRLERYRFTSLLERRTDSRIAVHSAQGRIEMIDITNSADASPGGPASSSGARP